MWNVHASFNHDVYSEYSHTIWQQLNETQNQPQKSSAKPTNDRQMIS